MAVQPRKLSHVVGTLPREKSSTLRSCIATRSTRPSPFTTPTSNSSRLSMPMACVRHVWPLQVMFGLGLDIEIMGSNESIYHNLVAFTFQLKPSMLCGHTLVTRPSPHRTIACYPMGADPWVAMCHAVGHQFCLASHHPSLYSGQPTRLVDVRNGGGGE